jgi:hypothetical protein
MVKVIWVEGGFIDNHKFAELIDSTPDREVTLKRVSSVQEAIVNMCESKEHIAMIICDTHLSNSTPPYQLERMARRRDIQFVTSEEDGLYVDKRPSQRPNLFKTKRAMDMDVINFVAEFMDKANIRVHEEAPAAFKVDKCSLDCPSLPTAAAN